MRDSINSPLVIELPCEAAAIDDFLSDPPVSVVEALRGVPGPFLVLGAGGKMGLHLSVMLRLALDQLGREDRVIAVSRFTSLRGQDDFQVRGVDTHVCDLADTASLRSLPEAPTVFFLAGIKFGTSSSVDLLQKINVEMPTEVAKRFPSSRIVAFSTGCIYPFVTPSSGGASEETPPDPMGEYAESCLQRERVFTESSARNGNPVALMRLNYSVEIRYGLLLDIGQKVFLGEPIDVTMGYFNVIWQRDAVAKAIQILNLANSPAAPINVTGKQILSVREVAHLFGRALQRPVRIVGQEEPTAWISDPSHVCRLLGEPETPLEDMVRWVSAWLVNKGDTWGKPTCFHRRDGRF